MTCTFLPFTIDSVINETSIKLNDLQDYYEISKDGKVYTCSRVSNVIDDTKRMPIFLEKWKVSCAVEALYGKDMKLERSKKFGWEAHKKKQRAALAIGSEVHHAIYNREQQPKFTSKEAKESFAGFQAFATAYSLKSLVRELPIYNLTDLVAGTIDEIGLIATNKDLWIIDYKTSKVVGEGYKSQVCAYRWMLIEFLKLYRAGKVSVALHLKDTFDKLLKYKKVNCAVVLLFKQKKRGLPYKFYELNKKEIKHYTDEFKAAIKLFNIRRKAAFTKDGTAKN